MDGVDDLWKWIDANWTQRIRFIKFIQALQMYYKYKDNHDPIEVATDYITKNETMGVVLFSKKKLAEEVPANTSCNVYYEEAMNDYGSFANINIRNNSTLSTIQARFIETDASVHNFTKPYEVARYLRNNFDVPNDSYLRLFTKPLFVFLAAWPYPKTISLQTIKDDLLKMPKYEDKETNDVLDEIKFILNTIRDIDLAYRKWVEIQIEKFGVPIQPRNAHGVLDLSLFLNDQIELHDMAGDL